MLIMHRTNVSRQCVSKAEGNKLTPLVPNLPDSSILPSSYDLQMRKLNFQR